MKALLGRREVVPGHVGGHAGGFGGALHLAVVRAVFRRGPGVNGAVVEGLRSVGDDQTRVEIDGVAETLAARACAERIVEAEQPGLGLAVGAVAGGALKGRGVAHAAAQAPSRGQGLELDLAGLAVAGLDGVDEAGANVGAESARRSARTKMGCEKSSSRSDSGVENSTMLPGVGALRAAVLLVEAVVAAAAQLDQSAL